MITAILPIRLVSVANLREHWAKKAKRTKEHRKLAEMALRRETHKCWEHKDGHIRSDASKVFLRELVIRLTRVAPRALDGDNCQSAFKGVRDGVADALTVADNHPNIRWEYAQQKGRPKEYAVLIEITERCT